MDKRRQMIYSVLICPECRLQMTVPRRKCSKRERHHIKDMYCIKCRAEQKFVEYKDTELMMAG